MTTHDAALVWVVVLPLLGAMGAFLVPRYAAVVGALTAMVLCVPVGRIALAVASDGVLQHALGGWEVPLGITLRADGLGAFMLVVATLVGVAVTWYATAYFAAGAVERAGGGGAADAMRQRAQFWVLWLLGWAALHALFVTRDLFNAYVTLELLGLSSAALVALAGGATALGAAMRYLLVSLLGSLTFLLGVALTYLEHATLDLVTLGALTTPGTVQAVALALMTAGLLLKTALVPLHFWLPPAHASAPAPVSALLSALVVKGSFYLLLRLWFESHAAVASPAAWQLVGAMGAVAVGWGSLQALRQSRLKLLVAYSTVAQLGYLFLLFSFAAGGRVPLGAWAGTLTLVLAHAGAKAAMFLSAGNLVRAAGHDRLRDLAGAMRALPRSSFAFALAAVSLVGLPPSGGFAAKWMLLNAALSSGAWGVVGVLAAGTLLSAAYLMRALSLPLTNVPPAPLRASVHPLMEWSALALSLAVIALGFGAGPVVELLRVGAPALGPVLEGIGP